ncbi:MAG: hypothetical protein RL020_1444 [Pseudomonadota bacterium]|jgi:hypothetical protein
MPRYALICTACVMLFFLSGAGYAAPLHRCTKQATEQAEKLLAFHFSSANQIEIAKTVNVLAPIRNPANKKQRLDVLELWGNIYKSQYRLRLLYARIPGECVLMGQEVLEYANY